MRFSNFLPIVSVYENGTIEVDFGDSLDATYDEQDWALTPVEDDDNIVAIFDGALGHPEELSVPQRLRRLADYIERSSNA